MVNIKSYINKQVVVYIIRFAGAFCFFYLGTLAIIGLSSPEGYYSQFVADYLNYIPPFRDFVLQTTKHTLGVLGYPSEQVAATKLRLEGGGGINLVYSCLAYGVTSFWLAFVFANTGSWKKKLAWMLGGTVVLFIVNIMRMSLVALASHKKWTFPFGWDHHTWFNIAAYGVIFLMIWIYDRAKG